MWRVRCFSNLHVCLWQKLKHIIQSGSEKNCTHLLKSTVCCLCLESPPHRVDRRTLVLSMLSKLIPFDQLTANLLTLWQPELRRNIRICNVKFCLMYVCAHKSIHSGWHIAAKWCRTLYFRATPPFPDPLSYKAKDRQPWHQTSHSSFHFRQSNYANWIICVPNTPQNRREAACVHTSPGVEILKPRENTANLCSSAIWRIRLPAVMRLGYISM